MMKEMLGILLSHMVNYARGRNLYILLILNSYKATISQDWWSLVISSFISVSYYNV